MKLRLIPARNRAKVAVWAQVFTAEIAADADKTDHPYSALCERVLREDLPRPLKRRMPAKVEACKRVCEQAGHGVLFETAWHDLAGLP